MRDREAAGQASTEFVIGFMVLALLVFGLIDVTRAVFTTHGLTRSAEAIAHNLALLDSTIPPTAINSTNAETAILAGKAVGGVGFNTGTPTTTISCAGYQLLSNDSTIACTGTATCGASASTTNAVTICAAPDLQNPSEVRVTVAQSFMPVTSLFIGGHMFPMSETVSAVTASAQE